MPTPALFPSPFGQTIRTWEGLFRRGQSGWYCDQYARTTRDYPVSGCYMSISEPSKLSIFNARDKYVDLHVVFASPYLWAGIWFLGEDGHWYLHRYWTNRLNGPGGLPWGGEPW